MSWLRLPLGTLLLAAACDTNPPDQPGPPPGEITVHVHNLCHEPRNYTVRGVETALPAGEQVAVFVKPDENIEMQTSESVAAEQIQTDGGHVWFGSDCGDVGSSEDPGAHPPALDAELRKNREENAG